MKTFDGIRQSLRDFAVFYSNLEGRLKMPKGHSNARVEELTRHANQEIDAAIIPIEGGADVYKVKPLPPLALRREEWRTIGERMDWFTSHGLSGGVLWLEFHDLGGRVAVEDLTHNGLVDARYQCERMIEELDEKLNSEKGEESENPSG